MKTLLFIAGAFLFLTCKAQPRKQLNGIWIPVKINWEQGSFYTIYIYNDSSFIRVASTQAKVKKDSMEFMTESGFNVESGNIKLPEKNGHFEAVYRMLHRTIRVVDAKIPGNLQEGVFELNVDGKGRMLLSFDGTAYILTHSYTKESVDRIKAIADLFVPKILKENNLAR
jgi:hypothetical protein